MRPWCAAELGDADVTLRVLNDLGLQSGASDRASIYCRMPRGGGNKPIVFTSGLASKEQADGALASQLSHVHRLSVFYCWCAL